MVHYREMVHCVKKFICRLFFFQTCPDLSRLLQTCPDLREKWRKNLVRFQFLVPLIFQFQNVPRRRRIIKTFYYNNNNNNNNQLYYIRKWLWLLCIHFYLYWISLKRKSPPLDPSPQFFVSFDLNVFYCVNNKYK